MVQIDSRPLCKVSRISGYELRFRVEIFPAFQNNSRSSTFFEDQAFLDTAGLSVPVLDPDYTALDKFLTGQVFLPVCNPFTRNRANSVTVLFKRVRTNFCQSQHWNGFFFYQRHVTMLRVAPFVFL